MPLPDASVVVLAAHCDRRFFFDHGIEDTAAGKAWADRHANWARQMPRDVTALWSFVTELDHDSRMALFAHCVALDTGYRVIQDPSSNDATANFC